MGDARHAVFEGNGNLLLDLFGGAAGPLGDDGDVVIGDVGVGFDGEVVEAEMAPQPKSSNAATRTMKRLLSA